jgi:uncharacterized protein YxjI
MGVFSKIHRFREAGQDANVNNVEKFGVPSLSLFTTTKVFTLHHHIDVVDNEENVVYESNSKFISLHDKTDITKAGVHVAHIERKLLTLHERHYITMNDGTKFELSNEIFHIIKDITNIVGLDWQLRGNVLGLNFELYDPNGEIIAVISQKMLSIHDKWCVDIYKKQHTDIIVAILISLQHMVKDREAASSGSSSGGSSGN